MKPPNHKRIYLHIGMPKTGTTTIQDFLNLNRDELSRQGYVYPLTGVASNEGAQHNLPRELMGNRQFDPKLGTWTNLINELASSPAQNAIISAEGLVQLSPEQIARMVQYLDSYEFKVLLYLRPQWDYIPSEFSQRAKTGKQSCSFDEFFAEMLAPADVLKFAATASKWIEGVGKHRLQVRPCQRSQLLNGSLIEDFFACVGLAPIVAGESRYKMSPDQNIRPGRRTLSVIQAITFEAAKRGTKFQRGAVRPLMEASKIEGWNETPANLISAEQVAACVAAFAQDNAYLAREFSSGKRESFFDPPKATTAPADVLDPSKEDLITMLVYLVKRLDTKEHSPSERRRKLEGNLEKKGSAEAQGDVTARKEMRRQKRRARIEAEEKAG